MTEKAKELRRQYLRKWRKEHPEKSAEYSRNYWERKAQKEGEEKEGVENE